MIRVQARMHDRVKSFLDSAAAAVPTSTSELIKRMTIVLNQDDINELKRKYSDEYNKINIIAKSDEVFTSYEKIVNTVWGEVKLKRRIPPIKLRPINIIVSGDDKAGIDAMFYWTFISYTKKKHISESIMMSLSKMVTFVDNLSDKLESIKVMMEKL
ncbi:MAG: hypothetical protein GXO43_03865 [Crenarchaeota archaeon]|nr:hypothetical protein [Thermoproteota archaeon]